MRITIAFTLLASLLLGCADDHAGGGQSHDFKPLHGGQRIDLSDHGPMIEMVQDEAAGTATLYSFTAHQKTLALAKAPELLISGQTAPAVAKGKGNVWVFSHAELKKHQHGMRVRISVAGKNYTPDWHPPH